MWLLVVDLGGGADTFTFSGGSIASGGMVKGGLGSDTIDLNGNTDVSFSGASTTGFEVLTKSGSGTATQSGSLDLGTDGQVTISGGKYVIASGATLRAATTALTGQVELNLSGILQGSVSGDSAAQTFVLNDGSTLTVSVDLGGGADTFTFSGGSIASGGMVKGGLGSDTIDLNGNTDVSFSGASTTGFEVLTKSGSGTVTQSDLLDLGMDGQVTISGGKYVIASGATLRAATTTLTGQVELNLSGILQGSVSGDSGAQTFVLNDGSTLMVSVDLGDGADTFTFSGGSIGSGGMVKGGLGSDTIDLNGNTDVSFSGVSTTGFEVLTKSGSATVTQSDRLDLGVGGQVTISGGKYIIASGATLRTATTALTGQVELSISGSLHGSVSGDGSNQTLVINRASALSANVDLGAGNDKLVVDSSPTSLTFTADQTGSYNNIENLIFKGAHTVAWGGNLMFAATEDAGDPLGFQKLAFTSNRFSLTVASSLTLQNGTVIDLSELNNVSSSIRLSAETLLLPASEDGLTIILPQTYIRTISLTLQGVQGSSSITAETILDKFHITSIIDYKVTISGTEPDFNASSYTLTLEIAPSTPINFINVAGTFTFIQGDYVAIFPAIGDIDEVTNVIIEGGNFKPFQGANLKGDSTFTWQGGSVASRVDATHGEVSTADDAHHDTLQLQPASEVTLMLDSTLFVGFEVLTKSGNGEVIQSGNFDLGASGSATISAGTYTINSGGKLLGNSLAVSGGILTGEGMVQLDDGISSFTLSEGMLEVAVNLGDGNDTFFWSGGSIASGVIVSGDAGSDTIALSGSTAVSFAANSVAGFEMLTKSDSNEVTQSGSLDLGTEGSVTISDGIYSISSGGKLLSPTVTVSGGSLAGAGMVQLGDATSSFSLSGGSVAIVVDLGGGVDTFTFSGGSIASGGEVRGGLGSDTIDSEW